MYACHSRVKIVLCGTYRADHDVNKQNYAPNLPPSLVNFSLTFFFPQISHSSSPTHICSSFLIHKELQLIMAPKRKSISDILEDLEKEENEEEAIRLFEQI